MTPKLENLLATRKKIEREKKMAYETPGTAKKEGEIPKRLESINDMLNDMTDLIQGLRLRIEPVLNPPEPQDDSTKCPPQPVAAPLVEKLQSILDRIRNLNAQLQTLTQRVEL